MLEKKVSIANAPFCDSWQRYLIYLCIQILFDLRSMKSVLQEPKGYLNSCIVIISLKTQKGFSLIPIHTVNVWKGSNLLKRWVKHKHKRRNSVKCCNNEIVRYKSWSISISILILREDVILKASLSFKHNFFYPIDRRISVIKLVNVLVHLFTCCQIGRSWQAYGISCINVSSFT